MPDTYQEFQRNRKNTSVGWATSNPVLFDGEIGIETDTEMFKIGDGTSSWNTLPHYKTVRLDITINGKSLTEDIVLTPTDVGAAPAGNYAGSTTLGGPASSAVKLASPITISTSGDTSGSTSQFDGSSTPVDLPITVISSTSNVDLDGGTY